MRTQLLLCSAALFAALLAPSASWAEPQTRSANGQPKNLIAPQRGARACFSRSYDARHLQTHPDQTVTHMDLRLAYSEELSDARRGPVYDFQLLVRFRGRSDRRPLSAAGECTPSNDGKSMWCGVECDGGGVVVRQRSGGKLLVDLAATGRIRLSDACAEDDEEGIELLPGKDDKTFLLEKSAASQCPPPEKW